MSFKCFFNSHFVFVSQIHISFLQGSSFRFAVIISLSSFLLQSLFQAEFHSFFKSLQSKITFESHPSILSHILS